MAMQACYGSEAGAFHLTWPDRPQENGLAVEDGSNDGGSLGFSMGEVLRAVGLVPGGDSLYFPSTTPHRWWAGSEPVYVNTPPTF